MRDVEVAVPSYRVTLSRPRPGGSRTELSHVKSLRGFAGTLVLKSLALYVH